MMELQLAKTEKVVEFDVVIVGAGIVGSALACALGDSDLKVAVVEARSLCSEWPNQVDSINGYDARVSALTVASQQFLQQIAVWPLIREQRLSPYQHMHVWDAEGTGAIDFHAEDIHQPELGHIVENNITAAALLQCLEQQKNIELISGVTLEAIESTDEVDNHHRLLLSDGRKLQVSLVVAADGANSIIRAMANFAMREWEYGHQAIVCTVETELSHLQTAWQRFLPEGPLAFLPLSSASDNHQRCSIVWSAKSAYAEELLKLKDREFSLALEAAFECKLGAVKAVSERFAFPLRQRHAIDYIKPGLALVGDAAHTIHPLAGQGVNLGLMDVQVMAEELLRAHERELDVGSEMVLGRYQRRRKAANLSMMLSMEAFKRLYEETSLPVRWARNTGMRWLDKSPPLKHRLMRQAMGL
jgi:2-octaprenylphenol hydroxylase